RRRLSGASRSRTAKGRDSACGLKTSLFFDSSSLIVSKNIPVSLSREFRCKPLICSRTSAQTRTKRADYGNSIFFSLLAGNLDSETGSTSTASSTTQSCLRRDFLTAAENAANWRIHYPRCCLHRDCRRAGRRFWSVSLWASEFRFLGKRRPVGLETGSNGAIRARSDRARDIGATIREGVRKDE